MKKIIIISVILIGTLVSLIACTGSEERDKPLVMTSLFPQYDFTRAVAGDLVDVEYLLPPGTSAHSFEPSARTVASILDADALIYTGESMEPWVHTLIESNAPDSLSILDLTQNVRLIDSDGHIYESEVHDDHDDHDKEDHDEDEHDHGAYDPHIWTDPLNAIQMVEDITALLVELVPEEAQTLNANKDAYVAELNRMHLAFLDLVENSERQTIMHGGHNAMGYFVARYNLEYVNPYRGFSTDAEPTPQAIASMVDTMNTYNIEHLFSEQLISPNVSNAISEETGATILYLYAGGNIPLDEFNDGLTFLDMLEHNLEQLKIGLGYTGDDMSG